MVRNCLHIADAHVFCVVRFSDKTLLQIASPKPRANGTQLKEGLKMTTDTRGTFLWEKSENGFVISDHSDHTASKEPTNPL